MFEGEIRQMVLGLCAMKGGIRDRNQMPRFLEIC